MTRDDEQNLLVRECAMRLYVNAIQKGVDEFCDEIEASFAWEQALTFVAEKPVDV